LVVDVPLSENLDQAGPEVFLLAEEENLFEVEALRLIEEIGGADKFKNLLWGSNLHKVINVFSFLDCSPLDHIEAVELTASSHTLVDGYVRRLVATNSFFGEVKIKVKELCGVRSESSRLRFHLLAVAHGKTAVRNLVEQVELFRLRRDIRHDDLASVGHIDQEFIGDSLIVISLGRFSLLVFAVVSVANHEIVCQINLHFFDLFFVEDQV